MSGRDSGEEEEEEHLIISHLFLLSRKKKKKKKSLAKPSHQGIVVLLFSFSFLFRLAPPPVRTAAVSFGILSEMAKGHNNFGRKEEEEETGGEDRAGPAARTTHTHTHARTDMCVCRFFFFSFS